MKEHEETNSKKVTKGFISDKLSIIDGIFDTDLAKVPEDENSTYTRTEQKGEQIIINLPNADVSNILRGYNMQYQAYVAENGAVMCGFAVNNFDRYSNLFNSTGLYGTKADPSLVLPYKFILESTSSAMPSFGVNNSRMVAMEMRGVRFYSVNYNQYTSNTLLGGSKYRIEVPVYNASFLPASNVKVKLYWVKDREESSLDGKTLIGESQLINMSGWSEDGNNKAWARIEFTPDMADGNYQFYALIDYAGEEVHKTRDLTTDPGGNNEGYFDFSVQNVTSSANSSRAAVRAMLKARASADDNDDVNIEMTYNGKKTWEEFFNEYVANTTGPVYMTVKITNNWPYTFPDLEIKAVYYGEESQNSPKRGVETVFVKNITLFENETYTFDVVIDADFADELRKAGVDSTYCYYTFTWLEELIPALMGLADQLSSFTEGDKDPELSVFTAEAESSDAAYFDEVVTKTYSLSNETPVFWRINDIFEEHSASSENANYVESSAKEDNAEDNAGSGAFLDDFNIVWNPGNADTVKTDDVTIIISTIPGKTLMGNYAFNVQTSEDGETWTDYEVLSSSDNITSSIGSSGGGCNFGLSAMALGLISVTMFTKKR